MIRRPLNKRFREAVLAGRKTTTIRDKAWPVGEPIMLFNWSGAPYRSKQVDVTPITVKGFWAIRITHGDEGVMSYECGRDGGPALYETEGFGSQAEMDDWFRPLVKRGETVEKVLMCFCTAASTRHSPVPGGSSLGLPWAIPPSEIHKHKADIQRQAIGLWKCKESVFAGEPRYERWRSCVRLVADAWMRLGPQADEIGERTVIRL